MTRESLNEQFAALHAHRVATMPPADLAVNVRQREELVRTANRAGFVKAGDKVANFSLPLAGGGAVSLRDLTQSGPVALLFFRFAGCPACNIALPYYKRQLFPELQARGISLLAVSPQVPEKLVDIQTRHELPFPVASDTDNALARRFGIVFTANAESQALQQSKGSNMGEITGTGTWELPMPAVIIIGRDGIVRYADISPDWLVRTEADAVIAAVEGLAAAAA